MVSRLALLALLPFMSGCIVVQHRHSLVDFGKFGGPLSDSDLVGRMLLIAAGCGLVGGVAAWIVARCFNGWRARKRVRRESGAESSSVSCPSA